MRDHHNEEGWISATWTHLRTSPVPFGDALWRHAHAQVRENGAHKAREAEIAAIADDLMDRAAQGPVDRPKSERRLTGRTTADEDVDDDVADVIPLPVFDARKEAQSWRL
ncbi:Mu transposase/integrase [Mycobacteroides abscessus subsp. abscessus]|nr:Mu transposase/integrase [Mycobacteroides abscessus subsp. abscessus]